MSNTSQKHYTNVYRVCPHHGYIRLSNKDRVRGYSDMTGIMCPICSEECHIAIGILMHKDAGLFIRSEVIQFLKISFQELNDLNRREKLLPVRDEITESKS